ncbi:MAG TPA: carboxypeptidase regulatory-like domain-containing protein [Vicinamibacterales bacterium]|nr:carboxypeptidase regulatory-like domain-containing protein [Vicinamibacterales bacterium]
MRLRNTWVGLLGIVVAVTVVACGGGSEPSNKSGDASSPSATPSGQRVDSATAGSVKGAVTLDGTAPANEAIKMNADPVCIREAKGPQAQETYSVGSDGKSLANVFVYVKDGLGNYAYDTPTEPARIDQKECRYHPHVFGMRVGQPLEILNSDPTLHNIHAMPKANSEFNNGQPIQGMKMTHTFDKPEVMVPFKCDVHGWMNAYVGVLPHPYYAVTKDDGKFELANLPPGTYTIEAWHEKLGPQTQSVTIGQKETKEITFSFKPATATATN